MKEMQERLDRMSKEPKKEELDRVPGRCAVR